ncbi:hypothetical protein SAMD00019534_107740 [Acytostelium subglobosum LB1]|uniref:hypothetical protein n=1 Tax=Acytostelium subglobosum LB1 TaxID=1410327 RepID=UPI000644949C|nr:hypothetical protein SAMD00019534_107740 [Acytostelium subglobosum LB1]GAM27598.1 hypothetical protein SAMD00019534_107740 [Acytostelium subglobosum LB1]|eukprot:XP_012749257.1 hypothetical protein SAMD00019534_107740 [Acytostelium subglobosum LB1]
METTPSTITLEASDSVKFQVDKQVANMFVAIKNMLEDIGDETNAIPLPNVTSENLKLIIEWCEYHLKNPNPEPMKDKKEIYDCQYDKDFATKLEHVTLFELILAANYLDIKGLLDVTCKTVANHIRSKTPDEIKAFYGLTQDFTPEEEQMLRDENEWCETRDY